MVRLIGQTYKNIEIIAVNDDAIDNSVDITRDYMKMKNLYNIYTK